MEQTKKMNFYMPFRVEDGPKKSILKHGPGYWRDHRVMFTFDGPMSFRSAVIVHSIALREYDEGCDSSMEFFIVGAIDPLGTSPSALTGKRVHIYYNFHTMTGTMFLA